MYMSVLESNIVIRNWYDAHTFGKDPITYIHKHLITSYTVKDTSTTAKEMWSNSSVVACTLSCAHWQKREGI